MKIEKYFTKKENGILIFNHTQLTTKYGRKADHRNTF